jgi:hypothetical protein
MRPWTPDEILETGGRRINVKRACNGCGQLLGDVTDEEMNDAVRGRPLLDVTGECGTCQGVHVLFAEPRPVRAWEEPIGNDWDIHVLCPGIPEGATVLPCAAYEPCGCVAPEDPLTVEFQQFLEQDCPASPTGRHQHLAEAGFVGAPTGACWYQLSDGSQDAAAAIVTAPGLYPVEVGAFDDVTPEFYPVDDLATYGKAATPA